MTGNKICPFPEIFRFHIANNLLKGNEQCSKYILLYFITVNAILSNSIIYLTKSFLILVDERREWFVVMLYFV